MSGTQGAREMAQQAGVGGNKLIRRNSYELSCPLELIVLYLAKRLRESDYACFSFPPYQYQWNCINHWVFNKYFCQKSTKQQSKSIHMHTQHFTGACPPHLLQGQCKDNIKPRDLLHPPSILSPSIKLVTTLCWYLNNASTGKLHKPHWRMRAVNHCWPRIVVDQSSQKGSDLLLNAASLEYKEFFVWNQIP